jgi:hypothetical protein
MKKKRSIFVNIVEEFITLVSERHSLNPGFQKRLKKLSEAFLNMLRQRAYMIDTSSSLSKILFD